MKILLVCSSGMSTSLLVSKMREAAKKQGINVEIDATGASQIEKSTDVDVVLLGPQVRYLLNDMRKEMEGKGIPVDVINNLDYGTMNGEKVLNFAIDLMNK